VGGQDQAVRKKIFKSKNFKEEIDSKCQLFKHQEILVHQTSG
jgi:hypothetical protein